MSGTSETSISAETLRFVSMHFEYSFNPSALQSKALCADVAGGISHYLSIDDTTSATLGKGRGIILL